MMVLLVMGVLTGALWGPAYGEVLNRYGGDPGTTWDAVNWQTLGGLNDAVNEKITPGLDFVGDTTNGGAFWASNANYLFFRMRVDETMEDSTNDTLMIMVDRVGYGTAGQPDYAFAYDTVGTTRAEHGLEMLRLGTTGATWSAVRMDDVDGNNSGGTSGGKISPPDFSATGGDGYLRTVSNQSTTSFGNTCFVDWAISWDYLENTSTTTLAPGQTLRVQFTSSHLVTDHAAINADVAGGGSPSSELNWSTTFETSAGDDAGVPEPCSLSLLALAVGAVMAGRRRRAANA